MNAEPRRYSTLAEVLAACTTPEAREGAEAAICWMADRIYTWGQQYKDDGLDRVFVDHVVNATGRAAEELRGYLVQGIGTEDGEMGQPVGTERPEGSHLLVRSLAEWEV